MTDESMQIGCSVSDCTSGIARAMRATSSARGSPTFTSSMSAAPCSATSISICERSSFCSCAWNALRPVGLIRSPMMQNGCSGPITTVLDCDRSSVSTRLPFVAGRDAELPAQASDPRLAPEADQMQAGDARLRECVRRELDGELEARLLGIGGVLDACDRCGRDG